MIAAHETCAGLVRAPPDAELRAESTAVLCPPSDRVARLPRTIPEWAFAYGFSVHVFFRKHQETWVL